MSNGSSRDDECDEKAFKEGVEAGRGEGLVGGMLHDMQDMIRNTAVPITKGREERAREAGYHHGREMSGEHHSYDSSSDWHDGGPGEGTLNTATRKSKIWTSLGLLVVSLYFLKGCSSSSGDYGLDALLGTIIWLPLSIHRIVPSSA